MVVALYTRAQLKQAITQQQSTENGNKAIQPALHSKLVGPAHQDVAEIPYPFHVTAISDINEITKLCSPPSTNKNNLIVQKSDE
jgi:hypothetical protein